MATIIYCSYQSPAGELVIGSLNDRLCVCDWAGEERRAKIDRRLCSSFDAQLKEGTSGVILKAIAEINEYFDGRLSTFSIPVLLAGTMFQRRVWSELEKIPYGSTVSYAEIARRIGRPAAVRAVASAIGANAVSIIVPCHRVIASDGHLGGYAGGLEAKRLLLDLEFCVSNPM